MWNKETTEAGLILVRADILEIQSSEYITQEQAEKLIRISQMLTEIQHELKGTENV